MFSEHNQRMCARYSYRPAEIKMKVYLLWQRKIFFCTCISISLFRCVWFNLHIILLRRSFQRFISFFETGGDHSCVMINVGAEKSACVPVGCISYSGGKIAFFYTFRSSADSSFCSSLSRIELHSWCFWKVSRKINWPYCAPLCTRCVYWRWHEARNGIGILKI